MPIPNLSPLEELEAQVAAIQAVKKKFKDDVQNIRTKFYADMEVNLQNLKKGLRTASLEIEKKVNSEI